MTSGSEQSGLVSLVPDFYYDVIARLPAGAAAVAFVALATNRLTNLPNRDGPNHQSLLRNSDGFCCRLSQERWASWVMVLLGTCPSRSDGSYVPADIYVS